MMCNVGGMTNSEISQERLEKAMEDLYQAAVQLARALGEVCGSIADVMAATVNEVWPAVQELIEELDAYTAEEAAQDEDGKRHGGAVAVCIVWQLPPKTTEELYGQGVDYGISALRESEGDRTTKEMDYLTMYRNSEHYADPTAGQAVKNARPKRHGPKMRKIFAIDPGTYESGWVLVEHDGIEIRRILGKGKTANEEILNQLSYKIGCCDIVIEMIASYGMGVGREVFETCAWIGRFLERAGITPEHTAEHLVYRREEKLDLCGSLKANDAAIHQALVDRYAYGVPNKGKGSKKNPGFFYGVSKDAWAAMAVAVTWFDKQKGATP